MKQLRRQRTNWPSVNSWPTAAHASWRREFDAGSLGTTVVTFDTKSNTGHIAWAGEPPTPPPTPPPAPAPGTCADVRSETGIANGDITPGGWSPDHLHTDTAPLCCAQCWAEDACKAWTWYSDGTKECHLHNDKGEFHTATGRVSGKIRN